MEKQSNGIGLRFKWQENLMEHIYAVQTKEELERYQQFAAKIQPRLSQYLEFLDREYHVCDLPRTIV